MELKSVRDYGLGSVLSYLEGRRVTFFSGIAISETYDIDGVYAWIYSYYNEHGTFPPCDKHEETGFNGSCDKCQKSKTKWLEKQAKLATSGFYPSSLLNDDIKVQLDICPFCAGELGNDRNCDDCGKYVDTDSYTLSYFVKSTYLYEESGTKNDDKNNENRKDLLDIGEDFLPSD